MGWCCSAPEVQRPEDIYASLVIPKPPPVDVAEIKASSDDDIPLFAPVDSDDDQIEISDTGLAQEDSENDDGGAGENENENNGEEEEKEVIENENNSDPDAVHFAEAKELSGDDKDGEAD